MCMWHKQNPKGKQQFIMREPARTTPLKIFSLRWDEVEKQSLCLPHYDHQEAKMISLWILPNTEVNPFWKKDFPTCIVLDNQEKHQEMKSINN